MDKVLLALRIIILIQEISKKPEEAVSAAIVDALPGTAEEKAEAVALAHEIEPDFLRNLLIALSGLFGN